jgi:hypothetical protein
VLPPSPDGCFKKAADVVGCRMQALNTLPAYFSQVVPETVFLIAAKSRHDRAASKTFFEKGTDRIVRDNDVMKVVADVQKYVRNDQVAMKENVVQ